MSNKNTNRIVAVSVVTVVFITPVIAMVVNTIIPPSAAVNAYVDPAGRSSSIITGTYGEPLSVTDAAGLITSFSRNNDGNPMSTVLPSGGAIDRTFDGFGNVLTHTDQTLGGTATFTYENKFNQQVSLIDALGNTTSVGYDSNGNPISLTTPMGRAITASYQGNGMMSSATDALGTIETFSYNADFNLEQLSKGAGTSMRVAQRTYTSAGYLDTATDPVGRVTDFDYDVMGRVTRVTLPDGRVLSYGYDSAGNRTTLTPPGQPAYTTTYNNVSLLTSDAYPPVTNGGTNQTSLQYNSAQQVTRITRADNLSIDYSYDNAGRLQTISLPSGNYTYNYSAASGLLDNITSPDGITLTYSYNNELLTAVTWSGGLSGSVGYSHDTKGRITSLNIAGQAFTITYSADDNMTQVGAMTMTYGTTTGLATGSTLGSINEALSYNAFGELTRQTVTAGATTIYDIQYSRDKIGRITQKIETISGSTITFDYVYDVAGRLSTVAQNNTIIATYTYDSNNNRLNNAASYDAQDRLIAEAGISYAHSAQGERTQKTQGANITQYQYNAEGALIGATLPNTDQINYKLDGQGRRVVKQVNSTVTEAWLYVDALNPVAKLDVSNAVLQRYIYANKANTPAYLVDNGTTYKIITDHLGSVRLVVDASNGNIIQRIDYDAWGMITNDTNPGFQSFAYGGGQLDQHTALTQYGLREYDANTGRWTSKDPIGFSGSATNLYELVSSDPINRVDPTGLGDTDSGDGGDVGGGNGGCKGIGGCIKQAAFEFLAKKPFNAAAIAAYANAETAAAVGALGEAGEIAVAGVARSTLAAATVGGTATALGVGIAAGALGHAIEPYVRPWALPAVGGEYDAGYHYPESRTENILSERALQKLRNDPNRFKPRNQRGRCP